jgi:hypothetical protein
MNYKQDLESNKRMIEQKIAKIGGRYNADFDIPAEPQVTWVDAEVIQIFNLMMRRIEILEDRVKYLETSNYFNL